jgi:hypothetical protein
VGALSACIRHPTELNFLKDLTMKTTVFIVPTLTSAGLCRIVVREGSVANAQDDYRRNPSAWKEVGSMNAQGRLINIDADRDDIIDELRFCEPLYAGLHFEVEDELQALAC